LIKTTWLLFCVMCAIVLPTTDTVRGQDKEWKCLDCPVWNVTQAPFRIFGNTYYVGVRGISSILITSNDGHILIDGALPESAEKIAASIRELGFRIEDVKLILNSHVHFDHAGGVAELQRLSGARVAATASSARVLQDGRPGQDDPQYGLIPAIKPVPSVQVVQDGETLRVGTLAITAIATPGHTPGGTSWSWKSCADGRCADMVYADSVSAVSADGFQFTRSTTYPGVLADFEKTFAALRAAPCDILLTPHPEASDLWRRKERRERDAAPADGVDPLIDTAACRRYAEVASERLAKRLADERAR
jgi:metallo-beta-lactamase class B